MKREKEDDTDGKHMMLNKYMLCMNSTSFGTVDPVFGYDIGYFMFQKPFIEFMIIYALFLVIGITIYSAIYYIAAFNIYNTKWDKKIIINKK